MRTPLRLLLGLLVLASSSTLHAQTRVGIGVGLAEAESFQYQDNNFFGSNFLTPSFYVPITFSGFRIEPSVGFEIQSFSENRDQGPDFDRTLSFVRVGTGLFGIYEMGPSTSFYYGARLGASRFRAEEERGSDDFGVSQINFDVAPTVGGEHFFGDHFSLGAEMQIRYTRIGQFESDDDDDNAGNDDVSQSSVDTRALFFFRFHF